MISNSTQFQEWTLVNTVFYVVNEAQLGSYINILRILSLFILFSFSVGSTSRITKLGAFTARFPLGWILYQFLFFGFQTFITRLTGPGNQMHFQVSSFAQVCVRLPGR